ncbi:response regulator [Chitinimonas sp.]|uniref:response regulator n=1 Tax=Chitinimonas sp. TaxID=1934313 RepID=UPI0035B34942
MESQPHILIADDYHPMRLAVQHVLGEMQLKQVHHASHGLEAQRILQSSPIALIIADWNMPGMSGYELLCWCRNNTQYRNVPFILLTAESAREQLARALAAGVSDFLVKPFTSAVLRGHVARLLQRGSDGARAAPRPLPAELPLIGLDAPSDERLARASVLVVDDLATNIEVIAGFLKEDYSVKVAINGRKALEIARGKQPPDLILLDIMMPEMDGYEVCRQLKADPRTSEIPVIFLTARDQADDMVDGFALGAVDYISKPAQPAVLKARLRTHLRLSQALRDLGRQNTALADNARLRDDIERLTRHDLKNPLLAVAYTAGSLRKDPACPPALHAQLDLLSGAAHQALNLVDASLTLYRIEQGDYQADCRPLALGALLDAVCAEMRVQFAWKAVALEQDCPTEQMVLAEDTLCRAIFANLLKNAIEAAPPDSTVTVTLTRVGQECRVEVQNRGTVAPAIRARFFDKYVSHGKAEGTGLGTYSARLLTEAQGGRISMHCDDSQDRCHITVYLPAAGAS